MTTVSGDHARIADELRQLKVADRERRLNEYLGKADHTMQAKLRWNAELLTTLRLMKVWPPS
jgi:hypothetical protein